MVVEMGSKLGFQRPIGLIDAVRHLWRKISDKALGCQLEAWLGHELKASSNGLVL
jgi:hypothetical protein